MTTTEIEIETETETEAQQIRKIIFDIKSSDIKDDREKRLHFVNMYPQFVSQYPQLFTYALDESFSMRFLDFMLEQREIYNNCNNRESKAFQESINKKVFDVLNEEYIEPLTKNT